MNIGIAGLGLIGGSMARAFHARGTDHILTAIEPEESTRAAVLTSGVCARAIPALDAADLRDLDVLFLCAPAGLLPELLQQCVSAVRPDCVVTDVGSVKGIVLEAANALPLTFVGGHPMAGTEHSGWSASRSTLLEGAYYLLIRAIGTTDTAVATLETLVSELGARPIWVDGSRHDILLSTISHLPHVTASALCNLLDRWESERAHLLAAGGFKDTTRIASSNPVLWTQISLANRAALSEDIVALSRELTGFAQALTDGNEAYIRTFFEKGRTVREKLL